MMRAAVLKPIIGFHIRSDNLADICLEKTNFRRMYTGLEHLFNKPDRIAEYSEFNNSTILDEQNGTYWMFS